jgi:hypothetical protein
MNTDISPDRIRYEKAVAGFEILLLVVAAIFIAFQTSTQAIIDNDRSRLASVDSLVERGTWIIDESRFHSEPGSDYSIIDKVKVGDHFYSSKPPVLPLLMAGEYWVVHHLTGMDFDHRDSRKALIWLLTYTFTGIPFLWMGVLFRHASRWFISDPMVRMVGLFILLFCNEHLGFSLTINNHVPGAALLFTAMVWGIGLVNGKLPSTPLHYVLAGLFAGLLPTFELPGAFFCVPLWLYLLWGNPRMTALWFTLGAVVPLGLHLYLTYIISGGILPFYMRKELYDFPGGYFGDEGLKRAMDAAGEYESKSTYFFHLSVGRKGVFTLYPVLLLSLAQIFRAAAHLRWNPNRAFGLLMAILLPLIGYFAWAENLDVDVGFTSSFVFFMIFALAPVAIAWAVSRHSGSLLDDKKPPLALETMGMGILTLFWLLFYTFNTDNYGGSATGYRWFMFFTPALQFFGIFSIDRMREGWRWGLVCLLVGISFYSGWQASVHPWSMNYDWPVTFLGKWITR